MPLKISSSLTDAPARSEMPIESAENTFPLGPVAKPVATFILVLLLYLESIADVPPAELLKFNKLVLFAAAFPSV